MAESNQIIQTLRESGQQRHPMHSSLFRATKFISVAGATKFIRAAEATKCITLFRDDGNKPIQRIKAIKALRIY